MFKLVLRATLAALFLATPALAADEIPFPDISCETTTTAGTGTVDLAGALAGGYLPFATQVASGNSVFYNIVTGTGGSRKVEVGKGVFTDGAPDTLTRVAAWSSDGVGAELTLSGTSRVCLDVSGDFFNQGAGSGLNADLLDGVSSGSFALGATDFTAGTGMTGGGTLAANRTFDVVGGTGITANADDIALAPSEMTSATWGSNNFTTDVFSTDGVDLTWDYSTVDGAAILSGGGSSPILGIEDGGQLRFFEEDAGGSNTMSFIAPGTIAADRTCQLVDGTAMIPDTCVGNGTDDSGGTGKFSMFIPAGAMMPSIAAGAACGETYDSGSNDVRLTVCNFDTGATEEGVTWNMWMPKNWNESTITYQYLWTNTAGATTQTVQLLVQCTAFSDDDTLNTAFSGGVTQSDTWLAQNDLHASAESSALTIIGTPAAGDLVVCQATRDTSADNMAGDMALVGIKVFYTTDAADET